MKKYMFVLCIAIMCILNLKNVYAIGDFSGGTSSGGSIGSGNWNSYYVGLKVSVVSSSNKLKETYIFVNSKGIGGKISAQALKPKTKQNKTIKWVDSSKAKNNIITTTKLPNSWLDGDNNINIYSKLSASKYKILLSLLNSFKTKGPGDYILVEPMVYIGGYYGTAFELGNDFMNSGYDNSFSNSYKKRLFGGSNKMKNGGLFYTTIYTTSDISAIGLSTFNDNSYNKRNDCLRSKTCGRGIGVFKYDDLYSVKLKIVKKEKDTNNSISGAGFTLYSDSNCKKIIKNEQITNSNGETVFYNLATGKYYYKETTIPSGYTGNSNCAAINVTDGKQTTKTVTNNKRSTQGTLNIYIKNDLTKSLITNPESQASYDIINGSNCKGRKVKPVTTSSGVASVPNLSPGTYSIKETKAPNGYLSKNEKCVKTNVQITANSTRNEDIFYQLGCDEKLKQSDKSIKSLLNLYQEFGFNGLLDYSNPICSNIDCTNKETSVKEAGCLSATVNNYKFTEYNMACFDKKIQDLTGAYVGFCANTLSLTNNLGENNFYNKAGQFLIKKLDDNSIQFYNDNKDLIKIENPYIATANVGRICYVLNGNAPSSEEMQREDLKVYFGKNDINSNNIDELPYEKNTIAQQNNTSNGFVKYSYIDTYNFNLNKVYIEKISGMVTNQKTGVLEQSGILIPFDAPNSGSIPFELKYGKINLSSDVCHYNSEQELIKTPPGDDNSPGKIDIEFRIINLEAPFLNENGDIRLTNSNWCDYSVSKEDQCEANNNVVLNNIINAPNSFGGNSTGPIYEIKLTSADIKKIREYNAETVYDDYENYCDINGCRNAFLYSLENGTLKKFVDNQEKKSYGSISRLHINKPLITSNMNSIIDKFNIGYNTKLSEVLKEVLSN